MGIKQSLSIKCLLTIANLPHSALRPQSILGRQSSAATHRIADRSGESLFVDEKFCDKLYSYWTVDKWDDGIASSQHVVPDELQAPYHPDDDDTMGVIFQDDGNDFHWSAMQKHVGAKDSVPDSM